jgi:hypothetical protein
MEYRVPGTICYFCNKLFPLQGETVTDPFFGYKLIIKCIELQLSYDH